MANTPNGLGYHWRLHGPSTIYSLRKIYTHKAVQTYTNYAICIQQNNARTHAYVVYSNALKSQKPRFHKSPILAIRDEICVASSRLATITAKNTFTFTFTFTRCEVLEIVMETLAKMHAAESRDFRDSTSISKHQMLHHSLHSLQTVAHLMDHLVPTCR